MHQSNALSSIRKARYIIHQYHGMAAFSIRCNLYPFNESIPRGHTRWLAIQAKPGLSLLLIIWTLNASRPVSETSKQGCSLCLVGDLKPICQGGGPPRLINLSITPRCAIHLRLNALSYLCPKVLFTCKGIRDVGIFKPVIAMKRSS